MSETKLLSLLQKKRGLFETILDLTENEEHVSLDNWINVLEQKKILLSYVEKIDQELSPFSQKMAHFSQEMDEEIEETKRVIEKILQLDRVNLEKRKEKLKREKWN